MVFKMHYMWHSFFPVFDFLGLKLDIYDFIRISKIAKLIILYIESVWCSCIFLFLDDVEDIQWRVLLEKSF